MDTTPAPRDVVLLSQWLLDNHGDVYRDYHASRPAARAALEFIRTDAAPVSPVGADTPDAVERVAAAMWPGPPEWGSPILESLGHAEQYRRMARAAITAVRSPGPAATARAFQNTENARDNQLPTWDQLSPRAKAQRVREAGRWIAAVSASGEVPQ